MSPVPDDILAHVSLFRRVSVEDRERLQSVASVRDYDRGDHVFREGDPSDYSLVVLTGRVTVYKHAPDLTGTTIETAIRIMSRWGNDGILRIEKDGVVLRDRAALETFAAP